MWFEDCSDNSRLSVNVDVPKKLATFAYPLTTSLQTIEFANVGIWCWISIAFQLETLDSHDATIIYILARFCIDYMQTLATPLARTLLDSVAYYMSKHVLM